MINELIHNDFNYGVYSFKNFNNLNHIEKEKILIQRNTDNVRRWMINNSHINKKEHDIFINSLKSNFQKSYWLVYRNKLPIGSFNLTNINKQTNEAVAGYYVFQGYHGKGWGVEFEFYVLDMIFNKLKMKKINVFVKNNNIASLKIQTMFNFQRVRKYEDKIQFELMINNYNKLPNNFIDLKKQLLERKNR